MTTFSVQPSAAHRSDAPRWLRPLAQAGLIAKGSVYCLLGALAFMAAFHLGGHSTREADRGGVFRLVREAPAGQLLLGALALGLLCYAAWRLLEAILDPARKGKDAGGIGTRLRYALSGIGYGAVAFAAAKALFSEPQRSDTQQKAAGELLSHPAGPWLAGAAALIFIGTGIYQLWYGWSEKYRKHVPGATLQTAGKIGYTARGLVWCLIGWLFGQAALHANASEAGDTSKALALLEGTGGTFLLAAIGLGLICYGVFNFIRARHDRIGDAA